VQQFRVLLVRVMVVMVLFVLIVNQWTGPHARQAARVGCAVYVPLTRKRQLAPAQTRPTVQCAAAAPIDDAMLRSMNAATGH
jgi:hypothetical protein